ncbi:MAG TPA: hypothetical protein VHT73_19450 [Thermodesulfobacteriota bacterium]|nr:hypothetical protein [Thermodesulfobacteriota bacterium]
MKDVCEFHGDPVGEQTVVPNLFTRLEWQTRYLAKTSKAFLDNDGQLISNLPALETRGLAAPQPVLETGEQLILIYFGYSQPHALPPIFLLSLTYYKGALL